MTNRLPEECPVVAIPRLNLCVRDHLCRRRQQEATSGTGSETNGALRGRLFRCSDLSPRATGRIRVAAGVRCVGQSELPRWCTRGMNLRWTRRIQVQPHLFLTLGVTYLIQRAFSHCVQDLFNAPRRAQYSSQQHLGFQRLNNARVGIIHLRS